MRLHSKKYSTPRVSPSPSAFAEAQASPHLESRQISCVRLSALDHEVFCVIYLTKRQQFIACQDLFRGTIDGASVYSSEVLKEALKHNAAAIILAHNHPSGIAEPSQADLDITKQLKKVLDLVDIRVLDHIIVAGGDITSFAERGLL